MHEAAAEAAYLEADPLGLDGYGNEPIPQRHAAPVKGPPTEINHGVCRVTLAPDGARYIVHRASSRYEVRIVNGALMFVDWLKPGAEPVRVMQHGRTYPAHLDAVIAAAKAFAAVRRWRPGCGW